MPRVVTWRGAAGTQTCDLSVALTTTSPRHQVNVGRRQSESNTYRPVCICEEKPPQLDVAYDDAVMVAVCDGFQRLCKQPRRLLLRKSAPAPHVRMQILRGVSACAVHDVCRRRADNDLCGSVNVRVRTNSREWQKNCLTAIELQYLHTRRRRYTIEI